MTYTYHGFVIILHKLLYGAWYDFSIQDPQTEAARYYTEHAAPTKGNALTVAKRLIDAALAEGTTHALVASN